MIFCLGSMESGIEKRLSNTNNITDGVYNELLEDQGHSFKTILMVIDDKIKNQKNISSIILTTCEVMRTKFFQGSTLHEAFSHFTGLQQEICLMVLNLVFPEMTEAFTSLAKPLSKFKTTNDITTFIDALIKSGVAAETDKGVVFAMGNTGVGKTSFVNTLTDFIENPSDNPKSILTEEHQALIETQVLEVYEATSHGKEHTFTVKLENSKPTLVKMVKEKIATKKQMLKIIDLGGHQDYFSCSTLFIASSGVFLICTDSLSLEEKKLEDEYYSRIGTYVDQICQATVDSKIKPKIVILATKAEDVNKNQQMLDTLLSMTKDHLSSIEIDTLLIDEVFITSSKHVTKEKLEEIYGKISALWSDEKVKPSNFTSKPFSWFQILNQLKTSSSVTLRDVKKVFNQVNEQNAGATNISEQEVEDLEKFKDILVCLEQIQSQSEKKFENINSDDDKEDISQDEPSKEPKEKVVENKNPVKHIPEYDKKKTGIVNENDGELKKEIKKTNRAVCMPENEEHTIGIIEEFDQIVAFESEEDKEVLDEIRLILDFFVASGEILWYKDNLNHQGLVITVPMDLIKTLRIRVILILTFILIYRTTFKIYLKY